MSQKCPYSVEFMVDWYEVCLCTKILSKNTGHSFMCVFPGRRCSRSRPCRKRTGNSGWTWWTARSPWVVPITLGYQNIVYRLTGFFCFNQLKLIMLIYVYFVYNFKWALWKQKQPECLERYYYMQNVKRLNLRLWKWINNLVNFV